MNIKYLNIEHALETFFENGYSVIIDDIFKRQIDIDKIISILDRYNVSIYVFKLIAEQDVLISRNRFRDCWDWIPEEKIVSYSQLLQGITFGEKEILIDTTTKTLQETIFEVLEILKIKGFYDPCLSSILINKFHPIVDINNP